MDSLPFKVGAAISVVILVVGLTQQRPVEMLMVLMLQWILTFCYELRFSKTDILGDVAPRLSKDPILLAEISQLADHCLNARSLRSPLVNEHLDHVIDDVRNKTAQLAGGTLTVDLGPGGSYLPDLVDICNHKYQAVSLVNLEDYWHRPAGIESLRKCANARSLEKTVERIFIERRANLHMLAPFVREHIAAKVTCFVVVYEEIGTDLRKDFAIIDDGVAGVHLILDNDRFCTEAHYCVNKQDSPGSTSLKELMKTWKKLSALGKPADEFLRSYPVTPS